MTTCTHIKDNGERCQVPNNLEGGLCLWHDPARRERAKELRAAGSRAAGAARRNRRIRTVSADDAPRPPETLEDAVEWLSWLGWAVTVGRLDARTVHEASYALRAFIDGRKALDRTDERVKELQGKLKQLQQSAERRRGNG